MKKSFYILLISSILSALALTMILAISGTIQRESGAPVDGIEVTLSGAGGGTVSTDVNGQYSFTGLAAGDDFTLTPFGGNTNCDLSCLNVYDMYLMAQHILGNQPLPSPFSLIAADINNSQTITPLDINLLHALLRGNTSAWNNNNCYRFVPGEYMFPDPTNPWFEAFPEVANINSLAGDVTYDFTAINIGDVSDCTEDPVASDLSFSIPIDAVVPNGDNVVFPIILNNFQEIAGFQFTVSWDPSVASYQGLGGFGSLAGFASFEVGAAEAGNGFLRVIWLADDEPQTRPDGSLLFELTLGAVGPPGLSTLVSIDDSRIGLIAVNGGGIPITPTVAPGSLTIEGEPLADPILTISNETANPGEGVCVALTVADFTDIQAFQFSINYDPAVVQFVGSQNFGLPGFNASNIGVPGPGLITLGWVDNNLTGQNLPDGTVLVELCFDAIAPGISPVTFSSSPTVIEFIDGNENQLATILNNGSITVEQGPATLSCPENITINNDPGECEAFVNVPLPQTTATDTPINDYTNALDASANYPVGVTEVEYFVFDEDSLFCTFTVTVEDTEAPVLDCPDIVQVDGDLAAGGGIGDWVAPSALDNCPDVIIDCSQEPGDFLPCGITVVTCTATDAAGNTNECNFEVVVDCPPPVDLCEGLSITPSPLDTAGHACCWQLDFSNPNGIPIHAVELTALDGIALDYTLAAGYFAPNNTYNSVFISPQPLGPIAGDVAGLAELCLNNVFVSPQQVVVRYFDETYSVFCTDTLTFECPIEPACLAILSDTISCDTAGYLYELAVQNPPGGDFDIGLVKLTVTEPAGLAGTYPINFNPALQPGMSTTLSFSLPTFSYFPGDTLCYILTAHNGPGEELCCFALEGCIPLPDCAPCDDVMVGLKILEDTCCYRLEISNNYAVPNYFNQLQTTLITPGVEFSAVEYPLNTGYFQSSGTPPNQLLWNFTSGSVPNGVYDLFDFCIEGVTSTDSICMVVEWLNDEMTVCTDTVKLFCPECILISEEDISCDPASGTYSYTFSGQNLSDGYTVNTIGILNDDPNFDVQPMVLTFPDTPPNGLFGPLNFDIIPTGGQPGDTLCLDLVLRQVINDTINIECCYVTHCIVLPPCEPPPLGCSCEELDADAGCGWDQAINCYDLTFTPFCLLDDCDEVTWLNSNGGVVGNTLGNDPFMITVPGPGIYTFLYRVTRTDDDGNVCNSLTLGQNVDVPACVDDCPEINCIAPIDVSLACNNLPVGFDPTNGIDLANFGAAESDCPDYSWFEDTPILNLNECNEGTITRVLYVEDPQGNQSQNPCEQVITVSPGYDYSIGFTADRTGNCSILEEEAVQIIGGGCDMVAINMVDEVALEPQGTECFRFERTYKVINWCEWDGESDPATVGRDEDCNEVDGNLDVWVHVNANGVFTDADNDSSNFFPAANTRGVNCDGQSNPEGYWRSSTTHPSLVSVGYWEYTQVLRVTEAPVNFIVDDPDPFCADPGTCEGTFIFSTSLETTCPLAPTSTNFFVDLGIDGFYEIGIEVFADGTVNNVSNGDQVVVTGTYPDWVFEVIQIPLGDHNVRVFGQNDCSISGFTDVTVTMADCTPPESICTNGLTVNLQLLNPPVDIDGDGNVDLVGVVVDAAIFDGGSFDNCSTIEVITIHPTGEQPDPFQTSLGFTCNDLGITTLDIYFWDEWGNSDFCTTGIMVVDDEGICPEPFDSNIQQRLQIHPNPVQDELLIQASHYGKAQLTILGIGRQAHIQRNLLIKDDRIRQNVNALAPGVYWLRLVYPDGTTLYDRFVKL